MVIAPTTPIATAPAIETAASATSTRARDPRPQRPPVELVERVRADPDGEEERGERRQEAVPGERGSERGADRDVAQVPGRVRRVEERDVVAPAAGRERVERGAACLSRHALPHMTMPPPRLSRRACTSSMPGLLPEPSQPVRAVTVPEVADARAEEVADLRPARRDAARRAPEGRRGRRPPTRPGAAAAPGPKNSSIAMRPPGLTTRASSRIVARRVVDVAQQVRERQPVEGCVLEGQLLGAALAAARPREPRPAASTRARLRRASRRSGRCRRPGSRGGGASSIATAAVPVATSSTVSPGPASIRETRNERQRGSWPKLSRRA